MEDEWISMDADVWKPEQAGDDIQGVLVRRKPNGGKYDCEVYTIENDKGQFVVFGTAVLEDRMKTVEINDEVKIVFRGVEKNSKEQDTKIYEVLKRKASVVAEV